MGDSIVTALWQHRDRIVTELWLNCDRTVKGEARLEGQSCLFYMIAACELTYSKCSEHLIITQSFFFLILLLYSVLQHCIFHWLSFEHIVAIYSQDITSTSSLLRRINPRYVKYLLFVLFQYPRKNGKYSQHRFLYHVILVFLETISIIICNNQSHFLTWNQWKKRTKQFMHFVYIHVPVSIFILGMIRLRCIRIHALSIHTCRNVSKLSICL